MRNDRKYNKSICYKNYDGQTLECNLKVEIPIRFQGITFMVDCYKDNRMQGN